MKKDTGQLHGELMNSLYQFIKDVGIHLPPDKIFDTTTSLIDMFTDYERYKKSVEEYEMKMDFEVYRDELGLESIIKELEDEIDMDSEEKEITKEI